MIATVLGLYSLLYSCFIWYHESDWLAGLRGIENVAYDKTPLFYIIMTICILMIVLCKKHIKSRTEVLLICICYLYNSVLGAVVLNQSPQINISKEMFDFSYSRENKCRVLCFDYQSYVDVLQGSAFYKYNEDRTIISSPVYDEYKIAVDDDRLLVLAVSDEMIDINVLKERAAYIKYDNWNTISFPYEPNHTLFAMMDCNILIPIKEENGIYQLYSDLNGDYEIFDLSTLSMFNIEELDIGLAGK